MDKNYLDGKVPNGVHGVVNGKPVTKGGVKGTAVNSGIGSKKSGSLPKEGKRNLNGK